MEWWRWKWGLGGKDFEGIHICSVYVKLGKWRWWIFFSRNYKLYTNNRQYYSNTLLNRSTGSAGLTPVVVWGVDLYAIRYLRTSSFHCLPSACAIRILFKRDRFCLSTSPFAWGHNGVVFLCSIPQSSKYFSNSFETNCRPLSLVTDSGKPWIMKILSRLSMIFSDVVERIISIS